MAETIAPETVQGHWVHSHEEDTATEMVFRPASYAFPPSRGRQGFELQPNGFCVEIGIGPADKPKKAQGTWTLDDANHLAIHKDAERSPSRVLQISSASSTRLVIRK